MILNDRWINQSKKLLKTLEKLSSKKAKDRLEVVNSMIFSLNALERSIHGWKSWVLSLPLMSKFTEEELKAMDDGLRKRIHSFINYDIEITKKHKEKIPKITIIRRKNNEREDASGIYV